MEADKCISTSSDATAKNQLTINNLDVYSLGIIFNMLPYIDRARIESVCQRWNEVSGSNWSTYSKSLRIGEDTGHFVLSYNNPTQKENILETILQGNGPYLEEITFKRSVRFCHKFAMGTIKWIAELCPNLKRLNTGSLMLNDDDWLACSNLEALSFTSFLMEQECDGLGMLFRNNKRLHRLEIFDAFWLTASDFDDLDPGQLKSLSIEYCRTFELTANVANKLADSLVELKYTTGNRYLADVKHLDKLKNLRSLDLKVRNAFLLPIEDIVKNCQKLECLFLAILGYENNHFERFFDLPYLRRLVIILEENEMPYIRERDRLLKRATHLEFFEIDSCDKCKYGTKSFTSCYRHRRN